MNKALVQPVQINESDLAGWSQRPSLAVALGDWWARHFRRGRGMVPRVLGRTLGRGLRRVMVTRHGAKLAMAPRAFDVFALIKAKGGAWEPHVYETCRDLLQPGDVYYDLGANVGYMTIETAVALGGQVRCVAFEPQPDLARLILVSAQLNGLNDSVLVFDAMIGERPQEAEIKLTSHSVHASAVARERGAVSLKRAMTSIDALVESGVAPPPSVIKIDIEGGELAAFRGAASVIRSHAPHILFEADLNSIRFGYTRDDLIRTLSELAEFEFFDVALDGALTPISSTPMNGNVLARSKRRRAVDS